MQISSISLSSIVDSIYGCVCCPTKKGESMSIDENWKVSFHNISRLRNLPKIYSESFRCLYFEWQQYQIIFSIFSERQWAAKFNTRFLDITVDFLNNWKIVGQFVDGNDLMRYCILSIGNAFRMEYVESFYRVTWGYSIFNISSVDTLHYFNFGSCKQLWKDIFEKLDG
jgi:hypothetical protein